MAVVVSAPGKVLMTGGYLVLERPNAGIVLSTNARFYAIVKPLYEETKPDSWAWVRKLDVKLTSLQMGREIMYKLSLKNLQLQSVSSSDRNPFVECALQYVVAAACATFDKPKKDELQKLLLRGLAITILGCNEFYSYRNQIEARGLPLTSESLASLPPFTSIAFNEDESNGQKSKPEVAKTGLGSSAAMTTAVVAALLHYLGVVSLPSEFSGPLEGDSVAADLDVVHVIAQTAHCIAQGKVGSGFDVSSAVYGSQRYVRFSPEVLSSAQDAGRGTPIEAAIGNVLKANWDHERTKFSLPPMMTLLAVGTSYLYNTDTPPCCRITYRIRIRYRYATDTPSIRILGLLGEPGSGGSSTPSMVGAVKKWQKSDPQNSLETWKKLSEANSALEMHLKTLSKLAEINIDDYKYIIIKCSTVTSEKWRDEAPEPNQLEVVKALLGARDAMLAIRCNMRKMGEAAGIPIEPQSQTQLLDTTMNMEGVLLAGVPGAGGFDAVFAVTLGESGSNVVKVWSSINVLALLVREDPRGVSLESNDPRATEITGAVSALRIE
ncbi:hypothetical protein SASPL_143312 [Salvia splendens]|uniref:phosphomevalonate kinase n=1 Tax=Salvia splendens TaxID=180675 RepID=A0A8X8WLL7_SALSN|nr:hypothetical protein SASPL_143312 [Salvia splendens]